MDALEYGTLLDLEGGRTRATASPTRRFCVEPSLFRRVVWAADLTILGACAFAAYALYERSSGLHALIALLSAGLVTQQHLWTHGDHDRRSMSSISAQLVMIIPAVLRGAVVAGLLMIPAPVRVIVGVAGAWLGFAAILMLAWRVLIALATARGYRRGWLIHRIAVYGVNDCTREYIEDVEQHGDGFGRVLGLYDDRIERIGSIHAGFRIDGSSTDLLRANSERAFNTIVLSVPMDAPTRLRMLNERFRRTGANIVVVCPVQRASSAGYARRGVRNYTMVELERRPIDELQALKKTLFDRAVAFLAILALSPLLTLIAVLIKVDSKGPVFFRQPRTGLNDRMFLINKFRTMRNEAADLGASRQTSRNDDRVTRIGGWLRRLSIDELPQLLNVLRGDMSLVGPRPHAPNTAVDGQPLEIVFADYVFRHRVKPGITGWAQVNRARGELRTAEDVRRRVEHDLYYIENWSLRLDVRILLLTFAREIVSSRAY